LKPGNPFLQTTGFVLGRQTLNNWPKIRNIKHLFFRPLIIQSETHKYLVFTTQFPLLQVIS